MKFVSFDNDHAAREWLKMHQYGITNATLRKGRFGYTVSYMEK